MRTEHSCALLRSLPLWASWVLIQGALAAIEACLLVGFGYAFGFKLVRRRQCCSLGWAAWKCNTTASMLLPGLCAALQFTHNSLSLSFLLLLLVSLAMTAFGFFVAAFLSKVCALCIVHPAVAAMWESIHKPTCSASTINHVLPLLPLPPFCAGLGRGALGLPAVCGGLGGADRRGFWISFQCRLLHRSSGGFLPHAVGIIGKGSARSGPRFGGCAVAEQLAALVYLSLVNRLEVQHLEESWLWQRPFLSAPAGPS